MKARIIKVTNEYELYLRDESKRTGFAGEICFPKSTQEVSEILSACSKAGKAVTVQGARTGVGGGAVPEGGLVMSLEKLRGTGEPLNSSDLFSFGAGMRLSEISEILRKAEGGPYFLPPDPTETSASIGGGAACNSSGARTYGYGPVRNYIEGLTVVLADGRVLKLMRGDAFATGRTIEIPGLGQVELPSYIMPEVKNAAGYYVKDGVDLVDIFIGSEGTLGIITEVIIRAQKSPGHIWGLIAFFEEEDQGLDCTDILREKFPPLSPEKGLISMEFFDGGSLELLRDRVAFVPERAREAVFLEICGESHSDMVNIIRKIEACIKEVGGNPDSSLVAGGPRMFEGFKELRHLTPVMVNERISSVKKKCPTITKLGSDMSVPVKVFRETVKMYRRDLNAAGLDFVIFGHVGNCHLHCNIISRNEAEYRKGKEIFARWAETVSDRGGSVSAEHGVGKLKKDFLLKMYGQEGREEMRNLKHNLDPENIIGRGNIL